MGHIWQSSLVLFRLGQTCRKNCISAWCCTVTISGGKCASSATLGPLVYLFLFLCALPIGTAGRCTMLRWSLLPWRVATAILNMQRRQIKSPHHGSQHIVPLTLPSPYCTLQASHCSTLHSTLDNPHSTFKNLTHWVVFESLHCTFLQICLQFTFYILQSGLNIPHFTLRSRLSTLHIRHPLLQLNKFSAAVGNYIFWCSFVGENMSHESSSLNCGMGMFCFFYFRTHTVCSPKPCGDKTVGYDMIASTITSKTHSSGDWKQKNHGNKLSCESGLRGVHSGWIQVILSHPEQFCESNDAQSPKKWMCPKWVAIMANKFDRDHW